MSNNLGTFISLLKKRFSQTDSIDPITNLKSDIDSLENRLKFDVNSLDEKYSKLTVEQKKIIEDIKLKYDSSIFSLEENIADIKSIEDHILLYIIQQNKLLLK